MMLTMRFGLLVTSLVSLFLSVPACVSDAPSDTTGDAGGGGDGSVASCASPGAPTCAHGKCDDSTGTAKCACDPGFSGPTCADACDGGSCTTTVCGSITCGPHQVCDDSSGSPVCKCAVGYAGGATCTWVSAPLDPGFQNTPPNSWTLSGGAVLEPAAAGSVEPGDVHFPHAAICATTSGTSSGRVMQTIQVPPYSVAEPLALNMTAVMTCSSSDQGCAEENGSDSHGIGVMLNGGYSLLKTPTTDVYSQSFLCLGERAFGGPLSIVLSADGNGCGDSSLNYDALVDHADIEPTPACPAPGTVTNADFEGTNGWGLAGNGGVAELKTGCGVASSSCGHLHSDNWSQEPQVSELMSVPGDVTQPNAALQISYSASTVPTGGALQVAIDNQDIGELVSTGGSATAHLCVPDWAKGMMRTVSFQVDYRNDSSSGNGFSETRDFAIDNFKWVTDASCPASVPIGDPGFEGADASRAWVLQAYQGISPVAVSQIATDANAHGGTKSLHLSISNCNENASASTTFTVPAPTSTEGPALTLYFKAPSSTNGELTYQFSTSALDATLDQTTSTVITGGSSSTWTKKTICIDPGLAGRGRFLIFRARLGNSCSGTFTSDMYIDDVVPTTDASCPH